ncbi:MAG: hypothetical protein R3266_04085 [Gemmatimonadota bacterium]|nr:hypothetical protein [Gemmatimonadota bacterium]
MKPVVRLLTLLLAPLLVGCASGGVSADSSGDAPVEASPLDIVVDNRLSEDVEIRIDARRVGEASALTRTTLKTNPVQIARRQVTVCAHTSRSNRTWCHPGRLSVPGSVREIWIEVRRGRVTAQVL